MINISQRLQNFGASLIWTRLYCLIVLFVLSEENAIGWQQQKYLRYNIKLSQLIVNRWGKGWYLLILKAFVELF